MTSWSRSSRFALIFGGATLLSLSASATCHHPKCSMDLNAADSSTVPVIVQYRSEPSDAEVGAVGSFGAVSHRIHSIHALAVGSPGRMWRRWRIVLMWRLFRLTVRSG